MDMKELTDEERSMLIEQLRPLVVEILVTPLVQGIACAMQELAEGLRAQSVAIANLAAAVAESMAGGDDSPEDGTLGAMGALDSEKGGIVPRKVGRTLPVRDLMTDPLDAVGRPGI